MIDLQIGAKAIMMRNGTRAIAFLAGVIACANCFSNRARAQQGQFHIGEASITDIQAATRSGATTCEDVVRAYLARAKAYNGICTALVTKAGVPIPQATGVVRAGSPIKYPTQTVLVPSIFLASDQFAGLPFEKVAPAYEAATHQRVGPTQFGPSPGKTQSAKC